MKKGFTLVEIMIVVSIIGVVAALTMPQLINNYQEQVTVSRVKETYSIFQQAYDRAVQDRGPMRYWDIGTGNNSASAEKLYNYFKPYLLKARECGTATNSGCFAQNYTAMFSNQSYIYQPETTNTYAGRGVLPNGTAFFFWSAGNSNHSGAIKIDINGVKGPNKAGVDFFNFGVGPSGITPSYTPIDQKGQYGEYCKYNDSSQYNGVMCTGWITSNGNMDYLHRDVEVDN